ncbi:uncharacterized protein LOC116402552 [Cucumis sativus]|uniref:uncharacterized protein LOC116402552 n=1 Tax=Cucumis sativus TaxID=3659 RepID=UPI0012F51365|nr:uncharacterized protein LOC116402552 [Cucumis sativus]
MMHLSILVCNLFRLILPKYELSEQRDEPVGRVELFKETHANKSGQFVNQAAKDVHNQMLELLLVPTLEGSQPLSGDEICETVLGRRPGYSKDLDWGPKPKSRKDGSSASNLVSQEIHDREVMELRNTVETSQSRIKELKEGQRRMIEEQIKTSEMHARQIEKMKKMIEEMTRAKRGP